MGRTLLRSFVPTFTMMLVSLVSYVDRSALTILAPTLLKDIGLSKEQYGWVISAFSVAYTLGNPLWGRLLDRVGVRLGMGIAVALWSAASAAHALVGGFFALALCRALLGFGEGATFPGGLRTVTQTLPLAHRGRGMAIAYSGGSLGAMVAPFLVTPVALAYGWRAAFLATGLLGAAWLLLFYGATASSDLGKPVAAPSNSGPPLHILDRRFWAFVAVYALGAAPLGIVLYGAPIYLHDVLGASQATLGKVLFLPPLGWELGYFFWGTVADRSPRTRRAFLLRFGCLAVLGLPAAFSGVTPTLPWALFLFSAATFVVGGFIILGIAYATSVFSDAHSATLAGVGAGSWSAVVALAMPLMGRLMDQHRHDLAFGAAFGLPLVGVALFWALTREENGEPNAAKDAPR